MVCAHTKPAKLNNIKLIIYLFKLMLVNERSE